MLLVAVFVSLLVYYSSEKPYFLPLSAAVFALACVTDALDGYLARQLDQRTTLGSYIDPIADKLLLVSGFLSLSLIPDLPAAVHIPAWVTIPVITRDMIILIGSVMIFVTTGHLKAQPLFIGKLTTVFQMMTLFFSLVSAPVQVRSILFIVTVFLTIASGVQYIRIGGRLFQAS